jgi:hypothetical protein
LESVFSNIPDRNPFFTDREGEMVQLHKALVAQGRAALSGIGGVGKTQAAVEYTYRHFAEYAYALWAIAHSHEALVSSYATLAGLLQLREAGSQDQTAAIEAVKRLLGSKTGWLLILDNADDLAMVREFIPAEKNGHVLLTTRARAVGAIARLVDIQEMEMRSFCCAELSTSQRTPSSKQPPRSTVRPPKKLLCNSMDSLSPWTRPPPISRRQAVGSLAI